MAPELMRVERIDEWPTDNGRRLWIIKGTTIESRPRFVELKTMDALKASVLDRVKATNRNAWVTWQRDSFGQTAWLRTAEVDTTRFTYEDGKHV